MVEGEVVQSKKSVLGMPVSSKPSSKIFSSVIHTIGISVNAALNLIANIMASMSSSVDFDCNTADRLWRVDHHATLDQLANLIVALGLRR